MTNIELRHKWCDICIWNPVTVVSIRIGRTVYLLIV